MNTQWVTNDFATLGVDMKLSGSVCVSFLRRSVMTRRKRNPRLVWMSSTRRPIATNSNGAAAGKSCIGFRFFYNDIWLRAQVGQLFTTV